LPFWVSEWQQAEQISEINSSPRLCVSRPHGRTRSLSTGSKGYVPNKADLVQINSLPAQECDNNMLFNTPPPTNNMVCNSPSRLRSASTSFHEPVSKPSIDSPGGSPINSPTLKPRSRRTHGNKLKTVLRARSSTNPHAPPDPNSFKNPFEKNEKDLEDSMDDMNFKIGSKQPVPPSFKELQQMEERYAEEKKEKERLQRKVKDMESLLFSPLHTFEDPLLSIDMGCKQKGTSTNSDTSSIVNSQPSAIPSMLIESSKHDGGLTPGFSVPLFDCCKSGCCNCLLTFTIPCIPSAKTRAVSEQRSYNCLDVCFSSAYSNRQSIRAKYNLGFAPCADCFLCVFCHCCLVDQTLRELKYHSKCREKNECKINV